MPEWLDLFVSKIYKKGKVSVAETNVQNLPKVNWKDETFYVNFTNDGAVLYNEYGNEVSLIEGAKSVEDVNKYLNENSIVASIDGDDSTDCEDKDGTEDSKDDDKVVTGNEDIPDDGSMDSGSDDVTASVEDSEFASELNRIADMASDGTTPAPTESTSAPTDTTQGEHPQNTAQTPQDGAQSTNGQEGMPSQSDTANQPQGEFDAPKTAECVCPKCGKNPCECDKETACKETGCKDTEEKTVDASAFVTNDSYNKLVARVKQLEKRLAEDSASSDSNSSLEENTNPVNPGDSMLDSSPTQGCVDKDSTKQASDYSGDPNSTGFGDIANGIGNAVSSAGDAIGDAWDSACGASQGDNIYSSKKDAKKRLCAYTEEQRAYTVIPNDLYDLRCEDEEVNNFNESAKETQKVIDKEHELDLSTSRDRAKLNETFLDSVEQPSEIQQMVAPCEVCEEDVPCEVCEDDIPVVEEEPVEDIVDVDTPADAVIEIDDGSDDSDEVQIIKLDNPEDLDKFIQQICPCCNEAHSLEGVAKVASMTGVVCNKCGKEFAVNDKQEIFMKK